VRRAALLAGSPAYFSEDVPGDASRPAHRPFSTTDRRHTLIALGIILLIVGFVAGIAILWTIGVIVVVIGVIFALLGFAGREIGGRKHWY
jgi:fatty acid desaturase